TSAAHTQRPNGVRRDRGRRGLRSRVEGTLLERVVQVLGLGRRGEGGQHGCYEDSGEELLHGHPCAVMQRAPLAGGPQPECSGDEAGPPDEADGAEQAPEDGGRREEGGGDERAENDREGGAQRERPFSRE